MNNQEKAILVRNLLGKTQEQMSVELGFGTHAGWVAIESGRTKDISHAKQMLLVEKFNFNPDWLKNGTGEPFKPKIQASVVMEPELNYTTKNDTQMLQELDRLRKEPYREFQMSLLTILVKDFDINAHYLLTGSGPLRKADNPQYRMFIAMPLCSN